MTSVFDPAAFLNATHEAGFATSFTPIPEGEYLAQIADDTQNRKGLDVRAVQTKDGSRVILTLNWNILDDKVKEITGMTSPTVRQDIWLDLDENGRLSHDKNRNIDLGRLLASMGLNSGTFAPAQIRQAGVMKVKVGVRPDKEDPTKLYNEVKAVTKYNGA